MIARLTSKVAPWLVAVVAALAGLWGYGRAQKKRGRDETIQRAKGADHERAESIRDGVERNLSDRVREFDDAGWRD